MANDLYLRVREAVGREVKEVRALGGGCVGEVYRARLDDGADVVVKVDRTNAPQLEVEGFMLEYLARHSQLPVPGVLHASPALLVMEFVEGDSHFSPAAERHAAELLAALHGIRGRAHGLERATLIGSLHQPNPWCASWVEFFREHRLLHMTGAALHEGKMPRSLHRRVQAFAGRIEEFLIEPEHPSLLHGDVWTTNVLANATRITGFLDPAVYYGHPEIELAFITLFSTFGSTFFEHYQQLRPVQDGFFQLRRDIYNFYPLLVHARLFGSSYLNGIDRKLRELGF